MIESLENEANLLIKQIEETIYTMNSCRCAELTEFQKLDNINSRRLDILKGVADQINVISQEQLNAIDKERIRGKYVKLKDKYERFGFFHYLLIIFNYSVNSV